MHIPYEALAFKFEGKTYYPMTDDVYEVDEGVHINCVMDKKGNEYTAYYTNDNVEKDNWDNPFKMVKR